ncbi:MAG: SDR family NAD(P)-dependent oxidoreductase [Acidimicrobiia bacterium]
MIEVQGQVAVVTGAAGGLGLGLARQLGRRGARVVLADIDGDELARAAAQLADEGVEAIGVVTDVTREESVAALADEVAATWEMPAVVCSNAGVSVLGRAWELSTADWDWVYAVNVRGAVHMINTFVPAMVEADRGHLFVTVSNTAVTARARYAAYGSSKHAVLSIAESLQQDLSEIGSAVGVTAVLPGPIASRMADAESRRPAEFGAPRNDEADAAAVREYLATHGVAPDVMATQVLEAADAGRFYCFTHPQNLAMVRQRAADMEAGVLEFRVQAPI